METIDGAVKVTTQQIYTWNLKQPFINGCLVKQPFSIILRFGIIPLKQPFINGCLGFQVITRNHNNTGWSSVKIEEMKLCMVMMMIHSLMPHSPTKGQPS